MMTFIIAGGAAFLAISVFVAISLRRVVPTNEVHIVQSGRHTISFGSSQPSGNSYYEWPTWVPVVGVTKTVLPVSVFDLRLEGYEAYDKDRVPFDVDIVSFFRIKDTNMAAQRVQDFADLRKQLLAIVQGAVRTVLASHELNDIMLKRSEFGTQFTGEVQEQLTSWGVEPVKNIELMDIRDADGHEVVHNIMQKKQSEIEMDSRTTVAGNMQKAKIAEITANQECLLQDQISKEAVGQREAQRTKNVGVAQQNAQQEINTAQALTKQKEMDVLRIAQQQQADIDKNVGITKADQAKQVKILEADGELAAQQRAAEAKIAVGEAEGKAETAKQMAPVNAQIALADKIGSSEGYQTYLIEIRKVEALQEVGIAQAGALKNAEVKIISQAGTPPEGMTKVMDLFSAKGGTNIGAMLEALANTDAGKKILDKVNPPQK